MIGFVRIAATDVVAERVTITLRRGDGTVLGNVSSVGTGQGGDEVASTEGDDPPVEFALRIARELAKAKGDDDDRHRRSARSLDARSWAS